MNTSLLKSHAKKSGQITVDIVKVEEVEMDEMWSFVKKKSNQRWLWHAIDHKTHDVLAYDFGARKDEVFRSFQQKLSHFDIDVYFTDDWGAYERNLPKEKHVISKRYTQAIERKHLTLRTRIKRLARRTICFSKLETMHDIVIGLMINRVEFGRNV